ncbi:predicted protein [Bathycoccus prasinos]|jgi:hypothetical protein|uniref:Succinate dehydrogenase assembly factor 4, mitochondrial n=1 Tax=Bathycoccus prasinos TaxID=41875 RepID=K8EPX1_9CHLO|nr:predicted protein [Bathycoccus prasinos]CCO19969.1 predicted protein [Bathycoccus prasinos]|eukprot:XP_007508883.1 predicted protein [Bathycoccus prasinos]
MNRLYVLKAFERTRKSALRVSSSVVPSSSTSGRFWSRSNAFSSSFLREQEHKLSRANGKEQTSVAGETERSLRRKEEPQNKFLESLRRETVENLEEHHVSDDAKEEEDFKPPTRAFSLREKTFREKRGELNMLPKEINGPRGLEPTRFKDWEVGGRCTDF